jgi:hypothetical protein
MLSVLVLQDRFSRDFMSENQAENIAAAIAVNSLQAVQQLNPTTRERRQRSLFSRANLDLESRAVPAGKADGGDCVSPPAMQTPSARHEPAEWCNPDALRGAGHCRATGRLPGKRTLHLPKL